jgi:anti-anti-sigma regulatory factor
MTAVDLAAPQQEAVQAFWDIYERHYDDIQEELRERLPELDPAAAALISQVPEQQQRDQAAVSRELGRAAARDGEWEPFLEYLETQGRQYAEAGMDFASWFRITRAFRPLVVPHLMEAHGDDVDELVVALNGLDTFIDLALITIGECYIQAMEELISKHREAIFELSTPVLVVRPGLLVLPVIGVVDSARSQQLTEALLRAIRDHHARAVVIDITGLPHVDTEVANRLVQAAEAARLMGCTPIITGLSAAVAKALVTLGVNLAGLSTSADLQIGIDEANDICGYRVIADGAPE